MYRLLVVDDYAESRVPLVALFGFHDVPAKGVDSGPATLAELAAWRPEVVVLAVVMPGMDGFEVLTAVRADPHFDAVAVLMYTSLCDPDARDRSRRLGAQGYVLKGTPFDALLAHACHHLAA